MLESLLRSKGLQFTFYILLCYSDMNMLGTVGTVR